MFYHPTTKNWWFELKICWNHPQGDFSPVCQSKHGLRECIPEGITRYGTSIFYGNWLVSFYDWHAFLNIFFLREVSGSDFWEGPSMRFFFRKFSILNPAGLFHRLGQLLYFKAKSHGLKGYPLHMGVFHQWGTVGAGKRIDSMRTWSYMLLCLGKVFEESASTCVAVGRNAFSISNSWIFASHMVQNDANP